MKLSEPVNKKEKRIRRRNNKRWINDLFIWERLRSLSTPIMFKKDDLAQINILPATTTPVMYNKENLKKDIPDCFNVFTYKDVSILIPAPPKITQLNDVRSFYKKTFGYRMNRRLSRTKQKELMEKIERPNRVKKIIFKSKGVKSIWKI